MYSIIFLYLFFYVCIFFIKIICQQIKCNINNTFTISKQKKSNNKDTISIPFTFDRSTKVGLIQPGDLFFGCYYWRWIFLI